MTEETKPDRRGASKGQRGVQPHVPTQGDRDKVERMAGLQISQDEIAMVMGVSADTIQRHYSEEFGRGRALQGVKLREHAYRMAYGVLIDPDQPDMGYKPGMEPSEKMTTFMLERQHGLVERRDNRHTIGEITPEAAEWLGRKPS